MLALASASMVAEATASKEAQLNRVQCPGERAPGRASLGDPHDASTVYHCYAVSTYRAPWRSRAHHRTKLRIRETEAS